MSLRWNASGDHLASSGAPTTTSFSFSCWVNRAGTPPNTWGHYAGYINSGGSSYLQWSSNGTNFEIYGSGSQYEATVGTLTADTWVYMAGYCSGTGDNGMWGGLSALTSNTFGDAAIITGRSFTPNEYVIGGNAEWSEGVNARIANYKAWDSPLSLDELLAEKWLWEPQRHTNLRNWLPMWHAEDNVFVDYQGIDTWSESGSITVEGLCPPLRFSRQNVVYFFPVSATEVADATPTTGLLTLKGYDPTTTAKVFIVESPTIGKVLLKGYPFDTQVAVRPELTTGNLLLKGNPLDITRGLIFSLTQGKLLLKGGPADLGSKSVIKSPAPGLSLHKGQAIEITRGLPVELTTGQVFLKGATVDVDTSTALKKSPTTERILFKGESFDVQAAIRPALTSGRLLLKGQPLDTQIAVKLALTTGRVVCNGYSPDTRAAVKPALSTGVVESKGYSPDTQIAVKPALSTGVVQLYGWPVEAEPPVQAASSVHINAGGTNVDRTDSAGVIWLYDLPFMTSANTNEQFASNTASMSGIVAPLDQNDDQHRALLADSRFDSSSTRNAGAPGILEYSFSLEGNYRYTLRLWGHEVVGTDNVTGGRVMTIAYDYGAGTTATFATTFDLYGLAGAYTKAAVYEQEFAVTADGAQSLRLEIAGGGVEDPNPLISAIEITSPGLAKVQLDPATPGILYHVGQAPDVSAGVIKKSPSSGMLAYQGQTIVSAEIHYAEVTTGVLSYKGATVNPGSIARVVSPGRGVITCKGASLEVLRKRIFAPSLGLLLHVGGVPDTKIGSIPMADATPVSAYLMHKGAAITGEIETDPWTHRDRDAITTWTEVPPDG